jgi:HEAT repeat protein
MRRLVIALLTLVPAITFAQGPVPTPTPASEDEHVEHWIRTVQAHPMNLVRKNAARMLGSIGDRAATPALVRALKDKFFGVRAEAARALGLLTDERAIEPLTQTSVNDSDALVRRNARDSLAKIQGYQEYMKKKQEKADALKTPAAE